MYVSGSASCLCKFTLPVCVCVCVHILKLVQILTQSLFRPATDTIYLLFFRLQADSLHPLTQSSLFIIRTHSLSSSLTYIIFRLLIQTQPFVFSFTHNHSYSRSIGFSFTHSDTHSILLTNNSIIISVTHTVSSSPHTTILLSPHLPSYTHVPSRYFLPSIKFSYHNGNLHRKQYNQLSCSSLCTRFTRFSL